VVLAILKKIMAFEQSVQKCLLHKALLNQKKNGEEDIDMNYGFFAIVAIGFLWVFVVSFLEYRLERKENKIYVPRDYDERMERLGRMRDEARRECQRPLILRRGRDGKWIW
jgi:hypothetical protein